MENQLVPTTETTPPTNTEVPPAFDIAAIFKTVQTLTQKVTQDSKHEEGGEKQEGGADFAKVFASIGKVLSEPSDEMDEVKKSFSGLGKNGSGSGSGNPFEILGGMGGLGGMLSSLIPNQTAQNNPADQHNVHATHQDVNITKEEKPLLPVKEKTVVLEVTEQEINDQITKKFTIDVAEKNMPSDVFALELVLEKNKYFYKFFLKERNLNLSFILDVN